MPLFSCEEKAAAKRTVINVGFVVLNRNFMCWCGHRWEEHNHSEDYGTYCCHWGIVHNNRQGSCKCKKFVKKTIKNWNAAKAEIR